MTVNKAQARPFGRPGVAASLLALALGTSGAWAQSGSGYAAPGGPAGGAAQAPAAQGASAQGLIPADRGFLQRAATSGLFEVEAARLAAEQSQDEEVKRFAATLVEQQAAANQELVGLAQVKGVTLPTTLPAAKRRELERLSRNSGEYFDAVFVQDVGIREYQRDLRQFREASRKARDPELRAWAAKMIPTLERHVSEARSLPAARRTRNNILNGPDTSS